MSALMKSVKIVQTCFRYNPVLVTAVRHHWNKDFKPAPYPKNDDERRLAAQKYGLHPDEYEPYPDDGLKYGDYPKLPDIGADDKDPFYPYDFPELRRNFQEPLHAEFDLLREDRHNISLRPRFSVLSGLAQFLGVLFGSYLIYHLCENVKMFHAVIPRQYPTPNKTHYTFEQPAAHKEPKKYW